MERKFSEIDWNQFTRMMVMETVSESAARDLIVLLRDHVAMLKSESRAQFAGFVAAEILEEEDGRMAVFEVTFSSHAALMTYSGCRDYRLLVAKILHLLIGDPVIKMFRRFEGVR